MAQEWPIRRVLKSAQAWKIVGRRVALTGEGKSEWRESREKGVIICYTDRTEP